jgi:hypothetical protein
MRLAAPQEKRYEAQPPGTERAGLATRFSFVSGQIFILAANDAVSRRTRAVSGPNE